MANLQRRLFWLISGAVMWAGTGVRADSGPAPTVGEKVNSAIDNVAATGNRLLELPLFMVLAGVVVVAGGMMVLGLKVRARRVILGRGMVLAGVLVLTLGAVYVVDRKIERLQQEVSDLRSRNVDSDMELRELIATIKSAPAAVVPKASAAGANASTAPAKLAAVAATAPAKPLLYDEEGVKKALAPVFANVTLRKLRSDGVVDVVHVRSVNPLVQVYVAVVDLSNPAVSVKLGADLTLKTLTSDFAKTNGVTLAVNGEAGDSPMQGSGFGVWHGNLTIDGKVLMKEAANDLRPFLSFSDQGKATFVAMASKDRTVPADGRNVIWGRMDAVVNGVVQTADERLRQPRTAVGLNADGTRLMLLVADGRQQNYSVGLTRAEVGTVLKAFGANNGMLCDEGGSSCMYLAPFGIGNAPSDGEERPTYTHFGVVVKK